VVLCELPESDCRSGISEQDPNFLFGNRFIILHVNFTVIVSVPLLNLMDVRLFLIYRHYGVMGINSYLG